MATRAGCGPKPGSATLLVHAQHKGVLGWGHVEPDDVAHLLHEQRIARELEGLDPVRLQSEGFPDAVDCRRRVTHRLGHRAQRPMRRIRWSRFQRQTDRLGNLVIADLPRRPGTRLVVKPVDAMLGKAPTPLADGVLVGVERLSDRLVRHPVRRREHDPRPPRASPCAVRRRPAKPTSSARSAAVKVIETATFPMDHALQTGPA